MSNSEAAGETKLRIPRIRIDIAGCGQELSQALVDSATMQLEVLASANLISEHLQEIVITDDLKRTVVDISAVWGISDTQVTREKESSAVAKTLYKGGRGSECAIVLLAPLLLSKAGIQAVFGQVMMTAYGDGLPDEVQEIDGYNSATPLDEILLFSFKEWFPRALAFTSLLKLGLLESSDSSTMLYVDEFRRRIKQVHNRYQANPADVHQLRIGAIAAVTHLITRGIEMYYSGDSFGDGGPLGNALLDIVNSVIAVVDDMYNGRLYDLEPVIQGCQALLQICYLNLDPIEQGSRQTGIFVTDDPKLLFLGDLVDTEQRFVAFLDILGFSAMIQEYDSNPQSNVLKFLKSALERAIAEATVRAAQNESLAQTWGVDQFYENYNKLIDYRMFSDCFCISLPYFDRDTDFAVQAASVITTIRVFIIHLLSQNVLIRGGLATGSYYSDEHVIFSGGLVEAYKLEKDVAKNPRVVVDNAIVARLKQNNVMLNQMLGLTKSLVIDLADGQVFINPFGLNEKIAIKLKDAASNVDALYQQLGITDSSNEWLRNLAKSLADNIPIVGDLPFEMVPPTEIVGNLPEIDPDILIDNISRSIADIQMRIDSGDSQARSVLLKYEWLLELVLWHFGKEDKGRFRFALLEG